MISIKELSPTSYDESFMIAGKMQKCYQASLVFGDKFRQRTRPIRDILEALMTGTGCNEIEAGWSLLSVAKSRNELHGEKGAMWIMLVCATVYDMSQSKSDHGSEQAREKGGPADPE